VVIDEGPDVASDAASVVDANAGEEDSTVVLELWEEKAVGVEAKATERPSPPKEAWVVLRLAPATLVIQIPQG